MGTLLFYIGYYLHEGFGSSSTIHLSLQKRDDGWFSIQGKMDQFSTGGVGAFLPLADELCRFSSARELIHFCLEYSFDPYELADKLDEFDRDLSRDLRQAADRSGAFPPDWEPEHIPIPPGSNLDRLIMERSGLNELREKPLPEPEEQVKEGKILKSGRWSQSRKK